MIFSEDEMNVYSAYTCSLVILHVSGRELHIVILFSISENKVILVFTNSKQYLYSNWMTG
jgi:hypothetical protein